MTFLRCVLTCSTVVTNSIINFQHSTVFTMIALRNWIHVLCQIWTCNPVKIKEMSCFIMFIHYIAFHFTGQLIAVLHHLQRGYFIWVLYCMSLPHKQTGDIIHANACVNSSFFGIRADWFALLVWQHTKILRCKQHKGHWVHYHCIIVIQVMIFLYDFDQKVF